MRESDEEKKKIPNYRYSCIFYKNKYKSVSTTSGIDQPEKEIHCS